MNGNATATFMLRESPPVISTATAAAAASSATLPTMSRKLRSIVIPKRSAGRASASLRSSA